MSRNDKYILKNGAIESKLIVDEVMHKIKSLVSFNFVSIIQLFELASSQDTVNHSSSLLIDNNWLDINGNLDEKVKNVVLSSISLTLDPLMFYVPIIGDPIAELCILNDKENN